jgi:hypothetical protein
MGSARSPRSRSASPVQAALHSRYMRLLLLLLGTTVLATTVLGAFFKAAPYDAQLPAQEEAAPQEDAPSVERLLPARPQAKAAVAPTPVKSSPSVDSPLCAFLRNGERDHGLGNRSSCWCPPYRAVGAVEGNPRIGPVTGSLQAGARCGASCCPIAVQRNRRNSLPRSAASCSQVLHVSPPLHRSRCCSLSPLQERTRRAASSSGATCGCATRASCSSSWSRWTPPAAAAWTARTRTSARSLQGSYTTPTWRACTQTTGRPTCCPCRCGRPSGAGGHQAGRAAAALGAHAPSGAHSTDAGPRAPRPRPPPPPQAYLLTQNLMNTNLVVWLPSKDVLLNANTSQFFRHFRWDGAGLGRSLQLPATLHKQPLAPPKRAHASRAPHSARPPHSARLQRAVSFRAAALRTRCRRGCRAVRSLQAALPQRAARCCQSHSLLPPPPLAPSPPQV